MMAGKARPRLLGADPINGALAAWWPLMEGAGARVTDIGPRRLNGSLTNSPTWTARGLNLAGINQFVTVPDNAAFDLSGGRSTVSMWIRGTYASQVSYGALFAKGTGSNNWGVYRDANSASLNIFTQNDAHTATFTSAYAAIVNGALNHVVWVQDNGTAYLYINGVLYGSKVLASPNNTSSPVYLGAGWSGVVPHVGQIGNCRVLKRALRPSEVQRLYRAPWAGTSRESPAARYYGPVVPPAPITGGGSIVTMPPDFGYPQSITRGPPNPALSV